MAIRILTTRKDREIAALRATLGALTKKVSSTKSANTRKTREITEIRKVVDELETKISYTLTDPILAKILRWQQVGKTSPDLERPYSQLPIVYACIRSRATNIAQVPLAFYPLGGDVQIERHPVINLFKDVNPTLTGQQLLEGIETSLSIAGNAFLIKDEIIRNGLPIFLWLFNPRWMSFAFDRNKQWIGYWLRRGGQGEKQFLEKERVIHFKYYNPDDELDGLSPMDAARVTFDTQWSALNFNKHFFDNDATPPFILTHERHLNPKQKEELKSELIDKREGVEHAGRAMLLDGGLDAKTLAISHLDVQFIEQMKFNREDICMIYKTPKSEVTLYEDLNLATARSADLGFWKKTLIPEGVAIANKLNAEFLNPLGLEVRFDFHAIDAINAEILDKVEAASKLVTMGYPLNMINERLGLGFEAVPWGDEPMAPLNPLLDLFGGGSSATPEPPPKPEPEPEPEPEKGKAKDAPALESIPFGKIELTKRWNAILTPLMPVAAKVSSDVRAYFRKVEQRLMKTIAVKDADTGYIIQKRVLEGDLPIEEIRAAFVDDELRAAVEAHLMKAIELGIVSIKGSAFMLDDPIAQAILQKKLIKVLEINGRARGSVVEKLREVLLEAMKEGVGEQARADMIVGALKDEMSNCKNRARTIARTEVNTSFSQGRWESTVSTQPTKIRWISSRDSKVRDSHEYLDGKTAGFNTKFSNGCRYPMDSEGSAGEVINCRCTYEPLYFDEEI